MKINYQSIAGMFMPYSQKEQDDMVTDFLNKTEDISVQGTIKAIIVPHAGYIYSGIIAAYGYKLLREKHFEKVILVGPSHREHFLGVAEEIVDHSVEVQLPFIRNVLPKAIIFPLVYGEIDFKILAKIIQERMKTDDIIIVSSDLSHYYPYDLANKLDRVANQSIPIGDLETVRTKVEACGITGILALLTIAKKLNWKGKLLKYLNSGDTGTDKSSVVGYGSYLFYEKI
jgi:predicted class III extradiol MEMO1 family dioxygenase